MKILLICVLIFYLLNLLFKLTIFATKFIRANLLEIVEFKISWQLGSATGNEYYYLMLQTPFYDEKKNFIISFGLQGFSISYVPVETMHLVTKEVFKDKFWFQTDWDCVPGLDIYTPDQIQQGILEQKAFTDGRDVFFIAKQNLAEDKIKGYAEFNKSLATTEPLKAGIAKREYFGSEGELVKYLDFWQIIHKDKEVISRAINIIFYKIAEKTLNKAKTSIELPEGINFSSDVWGIPQRKIVKIKVFMKNDKLIFMSSLFKKEINLK